MQLFLRLPDGLEVMLDARRDETVGALVKSAEAKLNWEFTPTDWWLESGSTVLPRNGVLSDYNVGGMSTVLMKRRLFGGGGDGGSTGAESRDCYLDMYKEKKASKVDATEEKLAKWTRCQLSGEDLLPPCVCDQLGSLFNKDAIVKALLSKSLPDSLKHIRGLKDLINLKLTDNPSSNRLVPDAANDKNYQLRSPCKFCCPVSGLEFNGSFRFFVHALTGHVISERAIKEALPGVVDAVGDERCKPDQWILLNGTSEEVKSMKDNLILQRGLLKRDKKRKRNLQQEVTTRKKEELSAAEFTPALASKEVYNSLFLSSQKKQKETYLCRSTAARGMNLT